MHIVFKLVDSTSAELSTFETFNNNPIEFDINAMGKVLAEHVAMHFGYEDGETTHAFKVEFIKRIENHTVFPEYSFALSHLEGGLHTHVVGLAVVMD